MQSSLEQAYSAIERSYAEGRFNEALEQAEALQPQLEQGRPDQLDQRLQLLIGHIYLYGFNQRQQAELAYRAALAHCRGPIYRQLAEQGLSLCQAEATAERPSPLADAAISPSGDNLPATPWLSQLDNPKQALTAMQEASTSLVPEAAPPEPDAGTPATPWQRTAPLIPVSPAEPQADPKNQPDQPDLPLEPAGKQPPEDAAPQWADTDKGLLLVRLSNRSQPMATEAEANEPRATTAIEAKPANEATVTLTAPSLGAAWTLFKRNWRTYLILEALVVAAALLGALLQLLGGALQGLAEVNPLLALAPGLALLIAALVINIWSNLLGVSLQVAPALAFQTGRHPSAAEVIALLRRDVWRLVRAGVVVGLATSIGLVLLIVPGLLVAVATPVIVRRVFCNNEPAWPAVLASVKEVSSGPSGAGLLKWELIAGLLILASVLLCGLPLLITVPLGGIAIQHYVAWSGLGLNRLQPNGGGGSGR